MGTELSLGLHNLVEARLDSAARAAHPLGGGRALWAPKPTCRAENLPLPELAGQADVHTGPTTLAPLQV